MKLTDAHDYWFAPAIDLRNEAAAANKRETADWWKEYNERVQNDHKLQLLLGSIAMGDFDLESAIEATGVKIHNDMMTLMQQLNEIDNIRTRMRSTPGNADRFRGYFQTLRDREEEAMDALADVIRLRDTLRVEFGIEFLASAYSDILN